MNCGHFHRRIGAIHRRVINKPVTSPSKLRKKGGEREREREKEGRRERERAALFHCFPNWLSLSQPGLAIHGFGGWRWVPTTHHSHRVPFPCLHEKNGLLVVLPVAIGISVKTLLQCFCWSEGHCIPPHSHSHSPSQGNNRSCLLLGWSDSGLILEYFMASYTEI